VRLTHEFDLSEDVGNMAFKVHPKRLADILDRTNDVMMCGEGKGIRFESGMLVCLTSAGV